MTVGVRGCVCPWSESTAQKTMVGGEENASQHPPQGRCLSPNEDDVFITHRSGRKGLTRALACSSLGYSSVPIYRGCGFDLRSGHIQEASDVASVSGTTKSSVSSSLPLSRKSIHIV